MEVNGFHGKGTAETVGTFPGFGEAVHAPEAGANGLALCEIEERYKVTYVQRVHYLVDINDDFQLVFAYIAALGAYGCLLSFTASDYYIVLLLLYRLIAICVS
jgi:hypothetical protein